MSLTKKEIKLLDERVISKRCFQRVLEENETECVRKIGWCKLHKAYLWQIKFAKKGILDKNSEVFVYVK